MLPRNAFGRRFDGGGYTEFGGIPGVAYRMVFSVMPMGDFNAVDFAQETHLAALQSRQAACDPMEYEPVAL